MALPREEADEIERRLAEAIYNSVLKYVPEMIAKCPQLSVRPRRQTY